MVSAAISYGRNLGFLDSNSNCEANYFFQYMYLFVLLQKLVSTVVDRGCHVVSVTDPYPSSHNLDFLDRSRYFSIK
jgi:hypothetical protein